jgi:hypothetical protein
MYKSPKVSAMPSFNNGIRPLFQSFHLQRTGASQSLSYLPTLLSFTWPVRVLRALFYPNFHPIQVVFSTRRPQMNTKSFIALIFLALASSVNAVPTRQFAFLSLIVREGLC